MQRRKQITVDVASRLFRLTLSLFAAVAAHAGTFSSSTTAPAVQSTDIANLATQTGSDKWFFQTNDEGDPADAAKGQTFITPNSALKLRALTYKISSGNMKGAPTTYKVRVGTVSGSTFTQIATETFSQTTDTATGAYMTWTFTIPVSLAPNTTYAIDVSMDSGVSWQDGIPYLSFTGNVSNARIGQYYDSGDMGVGDATMTLTSSRDRVFHLDLLDPVNPSPVSGATVPAGNVTLSWTNLTPSTGSNVWVDLWFGTSVAGMSKIASAALNKTTHTVSAPTAATYYWRIDSYLNGTATGTPTAGNNFNFIVNDTDGDGLPDAFELANTSPASSTSMIPGDDPDNDGLTNLQEFQRGTLPLDNDTDNDTLLDGPELTGVGSRPPTSPTDSDSDNDTLNDGVESNTGVWVSSSNRGTNPTKTDSDGDGLSDNAENNTGTYVSETNTGTNPLLRDSDGDSAEDWYEVAAAYTNPTQAASKPGIPYPLPDPDSSTGTGTKPVKVFILSGQSNMVGFGRVSGTENDTLQSLTRTELKFPNLITSTNAWTVRQDVLYRGVISALGDAPLAPGFGESSDSFGPELGFGHVMGYVHGEPVLIIKTSIGNRALGYDYLPPGSVRYNYGGTTFAGYGDYSNFAQGGTPPVTGPWYAGKQYDDGFLDEQDMGAKAWASGIAYTSGAFVKNVGNIYMSKNAHTSAAANAPGSGANWATNWSVHNVTNVVDVLDNFATEYPQWATRGFEIAGFGWFHGWNDGQSGSTGHAIRYEQNLAQLIKQLRLYYNARYPGKIQPTAPFVTVTPGFDGMAAAGNRLTVVNAQLAMQDPVKYPEFVGNVKTMEGRGYWRTSGPNTVQNYHYYHNAETCMLVGDAMGRGMAELLAASSTASQLTALTISSGTLTPAFAGNTFAYSATVSAPSITVTPTLAGASITVNGSPVASGAASAAIPLSIGSNTITIASTVSGSTSTYTLTITRTPSTYTWASDLAGPSSWSTAANWTPNTGFPNGIDDLAFVTNDITADNQISLAAPITLGGLSIGDSTGDNAYSLSAGHSITFNVTTGSATLNRTATGTSADTVSTTLILADPLTVSVSTNTGSLNINGAISQTGNAKALTKDGNGTLILNGTNSYTAVTRINAGTLQCATLANGGSNSSIGASSSAVENLILNGGTLRYAGAAVSTNRLFSLQASSTLESSGTGAVNFTNTGAMGFSSNTAAKTLTLSGTNTGANTIAAIIGNNTGVTSLNKSGTGIWVLSGANTYTGATIIDNGTLRFTTTSPSLTGGLTFGSAAGGTNTGNLDLSTASATFAGAFLVRTNSTNAITIGSGRTLQLNGAFTVGYNTGALPHSSTRLDLTGSGTLSIGTTGTPTNANVQIGNGGTTNVGNAGVLDMTGLANFYANLGTGIFRVGSPTNSGSANGGASTVFLAANSTIQAATLLLGSPDGSANSGATAVQSLKLGSGTTVINVDTLNLGGIGTSDGRSNGSLNFNGLAGTLKIRSQVDPVNGRANLNVGSVNMNTGVPQTDNLFDTTGHPADLRFGTMNLGFRTLGNAATTGQFKFDAGTLDANDLIAGSRGGTAGSSATATGIVSLGGGAVTIHNTSGPIQLGVNTLVSGTAAGTLNISGGSVTVAANGGNSIRLGNASAASGAANGTLNLTGGTLTVAGDIIRGAATGTSNAILALNGAVLDMGGNDVTSLSGITYTSGTLKNLGTVNTGMTLAGMDSRIFDQGSGVSGGVQGAIAGAGVGLAKQGLGSLTLSGLNTYTGDTTVNAGTLQLADNAQLKFVIGATPNTNNRITGTGTITLNGDFVIDTTLTDVSALTNGSWTIVDVVDLTESFGASFTLVGAGWSESSNVWTKTVGSKKYTFTEATGVLTLGSAASYVSWIDGFFPGETSPLITGANADPDHDGIENGVEMVLGGNPKLGMDAALLPTIEQVTDPASLPAIPAGNYLLFTYRRSDLSIAAGVTAVCETNTDLAATWTTVTGATPGVVIQVDDNFAFTPPAAADADRVRVYVPRGSNIRMFGRLKAMVP